QIDWRAAATLVDGALCLAGCAAQFGQTGPGRARHRLDDHGSLGRRALAGVGFAAHRASHALRLSHEQAQEASQLGPTSRAAGCRVGLKLVHIGEDKPSPLLWTGFVSIVGAMACPRPASRADSSPSYC